MNWSIDHARDIFLGPGEEPPLASHLVTPRTLYSHHGIYVGAGRVIHYSGLARGPHRGPVEDVSLEHFARGRGIRVRRTAAGSIATKRWLARGHVWAKVATAC